MSTLYLDGQWPLGFIFIETLLPVHLEMVYFYTYMAPSKSYQNINASNIMYGDKILTVYIKKNKKKYFFKA
jgi:hypothetical protein